MAGVTTPVVSPNAYANDEDLSLFWRDITDAEKPRVNNLLKLASNRLRMIASDVEVNLDDRVNADEAYFSTVQWVVMESTKRAMLTPTDLQPVDTIQQTAGPYSENIKYSNPSGDLWFKKSELASLGLYGRQSLDSLSTSQNLYGDIYSS